MKKNTPNFTKTMLSIAIPLTLQNLLFSSFTLIDTVMVGRLGDLPLAAVGMAGKWSWFLNIVLFGCTSGAAVFSFVFVRKPANLEDLEENTSLQRKVKKMYLEGDCIHTFSGAIFVEE